MQYVPAQITTPVKRANFGLDAGLRTNFFNGLPDTDDDWFRRAGDNGAGDFVIDTAGAAAIVAGYTSHPNTRSAAFARGMRFPLLSTINNRIFYDASYIRDHRGTDSTSFTGGSKNGMNPLNWVTTTSPVLSKNDLLDVFLHVRRDGVTAADTLWFFGAVSVQGTNGDRYFDFELYQTDIRFNRTTGRFENVGPDAGHTAWQFDAAGNPTRLGDIIFTAEYSNSGLTFIEARIWVARTAITTINPTAFDFSGTFDGDGNNAAFGYAGIIPNDAGVFYQGMQNAVAAWAGPFGTITSGGAVATDFNAIQLMEFSVNLTKLGLDPMNFSSGSICNLAFRRVLVKSRTSTSFTSNMTDFVLPFSFSAQPQVEAAANFPILCPMQPISNLQVLHPLPTSNYYWTTIGGSFVGATTGTQVQVDGPGLYIVHQEMLSGCGVSATDTIQVVYNEQSCFVLPVHIIRFEASRSGDAAQLRWSIEGNEHIKELVLERSYGGSAFAAIADIAVMKNVPALHTYVYTDRLATNTPLVMYRLRVTTSGNAVQYSTVAQLRLIPDVQLQFTVAPNPVVESKMQLRVQAWQDGPADLRIIHNNGFLLHRQLLSLKTGDQQFWIPDVSTWPRGTAYVQLRQGATVVTRQIVVGLAKF